MARRKPRPQPTLSPEALDRLRPRFDAIGPWQLHVSAGGALVEWDQPPALAALGCPAGLELETDTETGALAPDERMLALWDALLRGLKRHADHLRREMVAVYREVQPQLDPFEQERFPADLPDDGVIKWLRATVRVHRSESDGETYRDLSVSFAAAWDGEHSWQFDYDEEDDSFGEPSKG
jgi:hypothetical protein